MLRSVRAPQLDYTETLAVTRASITLQPHPNQEEKSRWLIMYFSLLCPWNSIFRPSLSPLGFARPA